TRPQDVDKSALPERMRHGIDNWGAGQPLPGAIENKPLFLRRAMGKWRTGDFLGAGTDLTRLLTNAKKDELDALSPEAEDTVGMTLAQFAAEAHWRSTAARRRSGPLKLAGVTPYEIGAMIPRLVSEYDKAVRD